MASDDGKKVARAFNDAIPLQQDSGGKTVLLKINPEERTGVDEIHPGHNIAEHLTKQGVDTDMNV